MGLTVAVVLLAAGCTGQSSGGSTDSATPSTLGNVTSITVIQIGPNETCPQWTVTNMGDPGMVGQSWYEVAACDNYEPHAPSDTAVVQALTPQQVTDFWRVLDHVKITSWPDWAQGAGNPSPHKYGIGFPLDDNGTVYMQTVFVNDQTQPDGWPELLEAIQAIAPKS